jgi:hypothetical protein
MAGESLIDLRRPGTANPGVGGERLSSSGRSAAGGGAPVRLTPVREDAVMVVRVRVGGW